MKANTIENLLADQLFKITKSDENFSNYMCDCIDNSTITKRPRTKIINQ